MICIIILPSAILLCINSVFLFEKQLLAAKVEQKNTSGHFLLLSPISLLQKISINIFQYFSKVILVKNYWHVVCCVTASVTQEWRETQFENRLNYTFVCLWLIGIFKKLLFTTVCSKKPRWNVVSGHHY